MKEKNIFDVSDLLPPTPSVVYHENGYVINVYSEFDPRVLKENNIYLITADGVEMTKLYHIETDLTDKKELSQLLSASSYLQAVVDSSGLENTSLVFITKSNNLNLIEWMDYFEIFIPFNILLDKILNIKAERIDYTN